LTGRSRLSETEDRIVLTAVGPGQPLYDPPHQTTIIYEEWSPYYFQEMPYGYVPVDGYVYKS
jgi:hypothetical protein